MYSSDSMVRHLVILAVVLSLLGGCSTVERRLSTTVPSYASLPNGRDPLNPDQYSELGKRFSANGLIPTLEGVHKRRLNILEISGGGPKGAFGAGVLIGWGESGTRPKFDVVTGISVGAGLSTWGLSGRAGRQCRDCGPVHGLEKKRRGSEAGRRPAIRIWR